MTLQTIGSLVSPLAFDQKIDGKASEVIALKCINVRGALQKLGIVDNWADDLIQQAKSRYLACLNLCESPIEQIMLAGLAFMVVPETDCFPPAIHDVQSGDPWPDKPVVIAPQFNIARYRLDFLVQVKTDTGPLKVAIECDGKQHHNEIKDRLRDFDRDDYLNALGIRTIRYSGAWIYKNAINVSDEITVIISESRRAA